MVKLAVDGEFGCAGAKVCRTQPSGMQKMEPQAVTHCVAQEAVGRGGRIHDASRAVEAATNALQLQQQTLHGPTTPPTSNPTASQTP